ncbi:DUF4179 domain-containing protein [Paenibacillus glacialis]|uniref:RNA polymerase subunit sigma n=1 Tax=Paenibacillus glacialis TaxID=494026 RepID=A0A168MBM4_9BACL|nr:DUF4179 domain-containing protein [Paenibacillus glacialis]OAB44480.1 RNA polymerase subunit sigma [Paenibacillus glacialis]
MESIEKKLKEHMNDSASIPYPDFEGVWNSIQLKEMRTIDSDDIRVRPMRGRKVAIIVGISVALLATPVYAAITYDWTSVLTYRTGIQSALDQGLGQTIEQSVTKNGVTLTLHTAFTDENRTVILYSLNPGSSREGKNVSYESIGLRDSTGNLIEGHYTQQWNPQLGVYQGYFESDWVVTGSMADVEFMIEDIRYIDDGVQPIDFDPNNPNAQEFPIQKDGIGSVTVQSFDQSEGKVLLKSSITSTDPELKEWSWARIQALNGNNELIREVEPSVFGTPGASGEYNSQQIFELNQLNGQGNHYVLAYDREVAHVKGEWGLNVSLSKKQLESGTFKENLNIPLKQLPGGTEVSEMIVTPTQIRLILTHEEKYTRVPYQNYQLDVGGTLLNGGQWYVEGNTNKTELRFEMGMLEVNSIANKPINLIAKHRVDEHVGNHIPVRLMDISSERKTITTDYEGYPVTWTYYKKDNNLYVESLSSDSEFGGVNQTYYLDGTERSYGTSVIVDLNGDGNNKQIDLYKNFDRGELEIYVWYYSTEKPEDELRVELSQGEK